MKVVKAGFKYLAPFDGVELLKTCERAGRLCYQSTNKITDTSYEPFIHRIIKSGHTSVLEHASIGVILTIDRGVTHELVRHRTGIAYSMESTRYNSYDNDKFDGELTVVRPVFWSDDRSESDKDNYTTWLAAMEAAERLYLRLLKNGSSAQEARGALPHSIKADIAVTANLREWRHIFALRCDKAAQPQMREIMLLLLEDFYKRVPVAFDDLYEKYENDISDFHAMRED